MNWFRLLKSQVPLREFRGGPSEYRHLNRETRFLRPESVNWDNSLHLPSELVWKVYQSVPR